MALFSRKRILLVKLESTYGTPETPTGSDAILVRNLDITPIESDVVSRDLVRPYFGGSDQLLANTRVSCSFEVELAGTGDNTDQAALTPAYDSCLRACGMTSDLTDNTKVKYKPISSFASANTGATIVYNLDGVQHKVSGARGTFTISGAAGEIPVITFEMTGIYSSPTDTSALTPDYTSQAAPLIFKEGNTTNFSFFGHSGKLSSVSLGCNNQIVYRELIGSNSKEVLITDRAPSGDVVIEAVTMATKDFFTTALGTSTGVLTFQHGTVSGNRVTVTANQCDISSPSYGDEDGIAMLNLPFIALPSSSGNDDFELVFD